MNKILKTMVAVATVMIGSQTWGTPAINFLDTSGISDAVQVTPATNYQVSKVGILTNAGVTVLKVNSKNLTFPHLIIPHHAI